MSNEQLESSENCYGKLACDILSGISEVYWTRMYNYIQKNNIDLKNVNCFILNPESMVLYFNKNFLAIEYCGNQFEKKIQEVSKREILVRDFTKEELSTKEFIEKIIGFSYDGSSGVTMPLGAGEYENLIIPTNAGADKLCDLRWNFAAQDNCVGFNMSGLDIMENNFVRLINASFFDCKNGDLKTRVIKWIDFIPLKYNDNLDGDYDEFCFDFSVYSKLWKRDMYYKYPEPLGYKYTKLPQVNRFIELFGDSANTETDITSFLEKSENNFIMSMAFMATAIYGQVECEWQSEERDAIKPDFFVVRANGYADIVEFKLPNMDKNVVVGKNNREQFNASINSYIAQTRVYKMYFQDPNNRKWFENKYKFKVFNPRRYLVIGRRNDFENEAWMEIKSEYPDFEIITYDDLVDTVVTQFYK